MRGVRKDELRKILIRRSFDELTEWAERSRAPLRRLFTLTYDEEALMRWRAVEAMGKAAEAIAKRDLEKLRTQIRGLIWLMSEESGGIGWHAPEAIAEIIVNVPKLLNEYAKLLPQFLEEDSFAPGTAAALMRIAPLRQKVILDSFQTIVKRLGDENPQTRAFLAAALSAAGAKLPEQVARELAADEAEVEVYDFEKGELLTIAVKRIALQQRGEASIKESKNGF